MAYDKRSAIALFTVLVIIAIATSFFITSGSIIDTDPTTYVIVPLLMLPLFCIFIAKNKIIPEVDKRSVKLGVLVFVIFIALTIYLRYSLSFLFLSYRVDMLLFPLFILSMALLLFGFENLGRFKELMVYALLASPLIFIPFIAWNQGFAVANTVAIYAVAKPFLPSISYTPPITISTPLYRIGIGEACVGVGILIAMLLFMLPLAYLYEGTRLRKAIWVISGFVLLLVLNFMRMLGIMMAWFVYGPSNAVLLVHLFVGILLFYIAIIVMMLLAGRYSLRIKPIGTTKGKKAIHSKGEVPRLAVALAVLFSLVYFAFTYYYSGAYDVSPVYLLGNTGAHFNNSTIGSIAYSLINYSGFSARLNLYGNTGAVLLLSKGNLSAPILVYITYPNNSINKQLIKNNVLEGKLYLSDSHGISGTLYGYESNGTAFTMYNTEVPDISTSQYSSQTFSIYILAPTSVGSQIGCSNAYDEFYAHLLNIFNPSMYNLQFASGQLSLYCAFDRLIK